MLMRRTGRELARRTPFRELSRLRHHLDRLLESPFGELPESTDLMEGWSPTVDVLDEKDKIIVKAEIPGMNRENIDVSVVENTLCICGERKEEQEYKKGQSYRSERYFGRFQRNIPLPQHVDANKVEAHYKDGVLTVEVPKGPEAKRKQIEVKVS